MATIMSFADCGVEECIANRAVDFDAAGRGPPPHVDERRWREFLAALETARTRGFKHTSSWKYSAII